MATYVPNATQTTEPTESRTVESAALEFRTLKASVLSQVATAVADEAALRTAADTLLQDQITTLALGAGDSVTSTFGFQNPTIVATDQSVISGFNAMSAGPVTLNVGVTVAVPVGSTWTIV